MDIKEFEKAFADQFNTMLNGVSEIMASTPKDETCFVLNGGDNSSLTMDELISILGEEARKQLSKFFECFVVVSKIDDNMTLTVNLKEARPILMQLMRLFLGAEAQLTNEALTAVNNRSKVIKSSIGREKALRKHAIDPKQQAKKEIKEEYLEWQAMPENERKAKYRSAAKFASVMRDTHTDKKSGLPYFDNPRVIERWCTEWKKELKNTHPA